MKLTIEIYRDYDHTTRKEFALEGEADLLNKAIAGITLANIVGDLTKPAKAEVEATA